MPSAPRGGKAHRGGAAKRELDETHQTVAAGRVDCSSNAMYIETRPLVLGTPSGIFSHFSPMQACTRGVVCCSGRRTVCAPVGAPSRVWSIASPASPPSLWLSPRLFRPARRADVPGPATQSQSSTRSASDLCTPTLPHKPCHPSTSTSTTTYRSSLAHNYYPWARPVYQPRADAGAPHEYHREPFLDTGLTCTSTRTGTATAQ